MTEPTALLTVVQPEMITPSEADLLAAFADSLRLDVAQGDASAETIRAYAGQVQAFVTWCQAQGIRPAAASEADRADRAERIKWLPLTAARFRLPAGAIWLASLEQMERGAWAWQEIATTGS